MANDHTNNLLLKTLWRLSPELEEDFARQLEAAVADCKQRPWLAVKREVTLKLTITPHPQDPDDVLIAPVTTRRNAGAENPRDSHLTPPADRAVHGRLGRG